MVLLLLPLVWSSPNRRLKPVRAAGLTNSRHLIAADRSRLGTFASRHVQLGVIEVGCHPESTSRTHLIALRPKDYAEPLILQAGL
jgi:hypothetical protein